MSMPLLRPEALGARVRALEVRYREIAATRMAGMALCHPGLEVAAVDFAPEPDGSGASGTVGGIGAIGVLVTPWFMNLVWLPLDATDAQPQGQAAALAQRPAPPAPALPVGAQRRRTVGPEVFEFTGAYEEGFGAYEACSLFSPVFEFADQAAAVATARAVLLTLRAPAATAPRGSAAGGPVPGPASARPAPACAAAPRRAFLFGRGEAA